MAIKFQNAMPTDAVPEKTEGYEGFIHLMSFNGHIEEATLSYIVRDHDREKFEAKKPISAKLKQKLKQNTATIQSQLTLKTNITIWVKKLHQ